MNDTLITALKQARSAMMDAYFGIGDWGEKCNAAIALADAALAAATAPSQDQQAAAKDAELPPLPVHKHTAWPHGWHALYTTEQMAEYARAAIASMSAPAPAAEDKTDYVRVPKEPTDDMLRAAFAGKVMPQSVTHQMQARARMAETYKAMIAAAPSQGNGERLEPNHE